MQQHVTWLTDADGGAKPSHADSLQSIRGLVAILLWATRHGHSALCDSTAAYFANEAPKGPYKQHLADVHDAEGHTVLHALVLSGQVCAQCFARLARPHAPTRPARPRSRAAVHSLQSRAAQG